MNSKRLIHSLAITILIIGSSLRLSAQAPAGYYDDADGKTAYALKTELSFIIDNHNDRGYNALWDLYPVSDIRSDGFVWDIYSNCDLTFGTDQDNGSGGTTLCDKYNREHTFPQSWFNSASTPRADAHMVLPTDKKMNSERGNFPYGETNGSEISPDDGNGAKKGSNTLSGYSGTVFEPSDEYKGDIARIYFYMATRYETMIDDWETNSSESDVVLNGTTSQAYEDWVLAMLLDWHQNDPVSQKEIDRNDAVFNHQGNRNPFVDHPEWVSCIWQNACGATDTPVATSSVGSLNFGTVNFEDAPTIMSFTVTGDFLTTSIALTSDNQAFLIATNASGDFASSSSLSPDGNGMINQQVFIQMLPAENINQNLQATITINSDEIEPISIALNATIAETVNTSIELNFDETSIDASIETPVYEVFIYSNERLTEALSFNVKLSAFSKIFFPAQFSTSPVANGTTIPLSIEAGDSVTSLLIQLDTSQLKTEENKSFSLIIPESNAYLAGEKDTLDFQLEGFDVVITSIKDISITQVALLQNPVLNQLNLKYPVNDAHFRIFNQAGQVIKESSQSSLSSIDISNLQSGLYLILINEASQQNRLKAAQFIKL